MFRLKGSDRPLLITSESRSATPARGGSALEAVFDTRHPIPRIASEEAGNALLESGVDVRVVRLPQVHDPVKQGLISPFIQTACEKGVVGYLGDDDNRQSATHVLDVAKLYVLALDRGQKGARYHAVAEEGVAMREIAQVVAKGLRLPTRSLSASEAHAHFGWMAIFAGLDMTALSDWTRGQLGWKPTGPSLIADLGAMRYEGPTAVA